MRIQFSLTILLIAASLSAATRLSAQTEVDTAAGPTDEEISSEQAAHRNHNMSVHMGTTDDGRALPVRKFYTSSAFDAALFQTAFLRRPGRNDEFTYLRFSYFVNLGVHFNYDFDENFGVFTGLGIKNIGFTQKESDSTIKRRVYTIGVPLGLKIGNLERRKYMFIGGGIDVPFNYREKGWKERKHKTKMNEWFSDRTEDYMTYVFVGASIKRGLTVKLQYYPGNFLDNQYEQSNADGTTSKPFNNWDSRLLFLSLGIDLQGKKKMNSAKPAPVEE